MNRDALYDLLRELPDHVVEEVHHYAEYLSDKEKAKESPPCFWDLIDLIDWEKDGDEDKVEPLVLALSQLSNEVIFSFQDELSEKLSALDGPQFFEQFGSGEHGASADSFLDGRCFVVARGKAYYQRVLSDPSAMEPDSYLSDLLDVAGEAYIRKNGSILNRVPAANYLSFYNAELWGDRALMATG